ncbi:MAG: ATP-binding protein [Spirochaetales bacterium]|nr:ATP-binding protein [Spirochaetales bacterium]
MYIPRFLERTIEADLFKQKAAIIYGPRKAGKTTLVNQVVKKLAEPSISLNGDDRRDQKILEQLDSTAAWQHLIGNNRLIVIDEAQKIADIGLKAKLVVDSLKDVQIILTGSSSFELGNRANEPLTGRKFVYTLLPLSYQELAAHYGSLEEMRALDDRLIWGSYPALVTDLTDRERILEELSESYLFKDILTLEGVHKPTILKNLLLLLALQVGSEFSTAELAQSLKTSRQTVDKYLSILEQAFIIFIIGAYSSNERTEIKKRKKAYFYDTGILNAIREDVTPLSMLSGKDIGGLWENYLIAERKKLLVNQSFGPKQYFWRNTNQVEIDYLEVHQGKMRAWEFKWNHKKSIPVPTAFSALYPNASFATIDSSNYSEFLLDYGQ